MNILKVSNISVRKGKKTIIENLDLELKKNEFIAILGPSGCGKTTLLNTVSGLQKSSNGMIRVSKKKCKSRKNMLMMFQEENLFPWLTIEKNLLLGQKKTLEIQKKMRYFLKKTDLLPQVKKYPFQLSTGMKKRIALIKMFINNPDIFLMDEVFNSLDAINKRKLQDIFLDLLFKNKKSVLFVTHDISEALFLADRVFIMTKAPMKIKNMITVSFKKPRKRKIFFTRKFRELEEKIFTMLDEEVQ